MARFSKRHYEATAEAVRRARATARMRYRIFQTGDAIVVITGAGRAMFTLTLDSPDFDAALALRIIVDGLDTNGWRRA